MELSNLQINSVTQRENIQDEKLKNKIPEGALYFEGTVSSGEKNRNGYIIDINAWFIEKSKYVKHFLKNGSVLYSHKSDKPIGSPLSFEKVGDKIRVSGYVFDDMYTNGGIGRGVIKGFSTGHLTHSSLWRNTETGEELNQREFSKLIWKDDKIWEEYLDGKWLWIVTGAEIIEFSFVTTPSNRDSVLNEEESFLANEISKNLNIDLKEVKNTLFDKKIFMSKEDKKNEVETKVDETKSTEVEAEKNNDVETQENTMETLQKEVEENKIKIETLEKELGEKNSLIEKLEGEKNSLEGRIQDLENEAKENILANANTENTETTEAPKDVNSFYQKYSK